ncbi:Germin-like protein sub 1 member 13 [Lathyrus oleraceus]|uniref:Germin-like protein n=1 Tax=Pisum sativum TaxID=3888 RepID=A0A9D5GUW3_PEA|nr:Germin-like protein sub 1 member 13 [Pisum sativum]
MKSSYLIFTAFLALASCALAFDPSPLQDFCVAINDTKNGVFVNGKFCKDPKLATANDFFFSVKEGNTSNSLGSKVTPVTVNEILGLNTLGISLARIDFAPRGLNPPHTHPRVLNKGDVFVFPIGLIHFQLNVGYGNAVAIGGLSSQNPGVITIANAVFGSNPEISSEVLTKAFQVDNKIVDNLQKQFWFDNN